MRHSRRPVFPRRRQRSPRSRWLLRGLAAAALLLLAWAGWHWRRTLMSGAVEQVVYRSHIQRVESHAEAIRFAASESRVDPNLLAAMMLSESGGRVGAVSSVGALGLFQLMLPTAVERARALRLPEPTREDLLRDPLLNARLAASYLKWLERRYDGHLEQMLIAYNAGPGRLARWIRDAGGYHAWRAEREAAGDSEVLRYVAKVRHFHEIFAQRALVAPLVDQPPGVPVLFDEPAVPYGPLLSDAHDDDSSLDPGRSP